MQKHLDCVNTEDNLTSSFTSEDSTTSNARKLASSSVFSYSLFSVLLQSPLLIYYKPLVARAPKRKIKNISSIKSLKTSLILQEIYIISLWVKECLNMMPSILLDNMHEGLSCCSKRFLLFLLDLNFRLHTHTPYGCESW